MFRARRPSLLASTLVCLATAAIVAGPAVAAPVSATISGTDGRFRLTFQVPGDYGQQGSVTNGGPLNGRYVAGHDLGTGATCVTAMSVRGQLRSAGRRPVRDGSVVRWRVGGRTESLTRVDAAARLADGGRWWTSGASSIDTRTDFPTTEGRPFFRFGVADVRAPADLPTGRSVLVKVVVTSSVALPPGPLPAPGTARPEPSATQQEDCAAYARRRLPADVRRVLRHLDVRRAVDAGPQTG